MKSSAIINTDFASVEHTDTIGEATARMLSRHVTDLPVIDSAGRLLGMLKLQSLLAVLLPKAALLGDGIPDLAFVSDTLDQLCSRMRGIENKTVGEFIVKADAVVHADTSPIEIVLLLYKGNNNIPVVSGDDRKLVGMVAARDVLTALQHTS